MPEDTPEYDTQQQTDFERGYQIREHAASYQVAVPLLYIDINDGNMYDGILFAQIMYWHGKGKDGKPRLRVRREGHLWLAKQYDEWWDECRVRASTARKSIERMVDKGLLIKRVFKFGEKTTTHVRVNWERFRELSEELLEDERPEIADQNDTRGHSRMPLEDSPSYTDTTTEEDYAEISALNLVSILSQTIPQIVEWARTATVEEVRCVMQAESEAKKPRSSLLKKLKPLTRPGYSDLVAGVARTWKGIKTDESEKWAMLYKSEKNRTLLHNSADALYECGVRNCDMQPFYEWFMAHHWKGRDKRQRPAPNDIVENWLDFEEHRANGNKPPQPDANGIVAATGVRQWELTN